MISFVTCSSDDDSPTPPDGGGAAKVKEFRRITTQTDLVINGIQNILVFDYNADGKASRVIDRTIYQN